MYSFKGYHSSMNPLNIKNNIVEMGEKIYYQIKPTLEKKYKSNYYVTIEVDSGKYFVGINPIESLHKAKKEFPEKQFFLAQVGRLTGHFL